MEVNELFMRRALDLARLGEGFTRPNPLVGAVVVHQGRVVGEGYHHCFGQAHAEVEAIHSVKNPEVLPQSTLYVTLEPCSHFGKTPPCADLIIRSRIPRVVIAMLDPYPEVSGRGYQRLLQAGIEVLVGVLEEDAKMLNAPFITMHQKRRPYISLKWAESSDGYMDKLRSSYQEKPIVFSSPFQLRLVHYRRMLLQAILVGYRTALLDNPSLTNRYWYGRHPIRIILDRDLSLPTDLRVFTDLLAPTWVLYSHQITPSKAWEELGGVRLIPINYERSLAEEVVSCLYREGIQSVLVEGGAKTLEAFLSSGLYADVSREVSSICLGSGVCAPNMRL